MTSVPLLNQGEVEELGVAAVAPTLSPAMGPIVWASALGTIIEWYDFLIYGTAAALVLNQLFFPRLDPLAGTLAAFGSYAVGFVARPLGGAIFGHFGDRVGRKTMLTLTMLIMGIGTFLIGCLPSYAQIGIWAPILLVLLRIFQGIGVGGEWGGAILMVLEHAPIEKRGFYSSLVQIGLPAGIAASAGTFLWLTTLPQASFLTWGWRLPFLASGVLVAFGLFVRLRLVETPAFARVKESHAEARMPFLEVILKQPRAFFIAVGLKISETAWFYVLTVYALFYATKFLALPRSLILAAIMIGAVFEFITLPFFGWLSDRIGRKPVFVAGALISAACAFLIFPLIATRNPVIIISSIAVIMSLSHAMLFGPEGAFMSELFGTRVRYSGASLGCQVSAALAGGFSPIVATALVAWVGATWPVSVLLVGLSLITLIATLAAQETKAVNLAEF